MNACIIIQYNHTIHSQGKVITRGEADVYNMFCNMYLVFTINFTAVICVQNIVFYNTNG